MGSVIGAVSGGIIGGNASKKAAKTQAAATDRASQIQKDMYDQTRKDLQPYTQAGVQASGNLMNLLGLGTGSSTEALQQDPSYQFRLQTGLDGVQSGAAAQGNLLSGATQKALSDYGQNTASQEYGNAYNRLLGVTSLGQNAAAQVGNTGTSVAQSVANNTMQGANASAAGTIGSANALTNMLGGIGSGLTGAYQNYKSTGSWI